MSSSVPSPQASCERQVFASPDGTLAFEDCPKLEGSGRIRRSLGPSGCLKRSTPDLKQTM